jgi:LCP family protein required for cell wall assembly
MPDDEQRPQGPSNERPDGQPDYKVYRSRRGIFSRLKGGDLPRSGEAEPGAGGIGGGARGPGDPGSPPDEPGRTDYGRGRREGPSLRSLPPLKLPWKRREERRSRPGRRKPPARRIAFWVGIAIVGWIFVSLLAFAISAQLQSFKLSGEAKDALHGNPFILPSAQNILVMGTDARPVDTKEPGAAHNPKCFEQQEKGESPHAPCSQGEYRADTLMVIRAGGGTFNKLSIPRDSYAEIPGYQPTKINAAFAYGGAALQIKTVEKFLNIKIDHVAIINFTGLENLVDAVGGVQVNLKHKLCAEIAGGAGGGQGGITLHLKKGENTLNGEQALAYSRIREPSECPGKGKSAYTLGYSDLDRENAQQEVINGIKDRLTSITRIPYNFIKGPIIGWDAPKAFVSDMGFFTMPQLVISAALGGSSAANVLCGTSKKEAEKCSLDGPEGSIEIPQSVRRKAVHRLMG